MGAWTGRGTVPEEPIYNFDVAGELGYGQSKLISECLLDQAAKISGVRSACCRVGIVAGPVEKKLGLWNRHEYIPSVSFLASIVCFSEASDTSTCRLSSHLLPLEGSQSPSRLESGLTGCP